MFLQGTYNYIKGYTKIQVEGYFVERFINLCMNQNVKVWDIARKFEGIIILKIETRDLNKVEELAKTTRSCIRIVEEKGVPHIIQTYKKRKNFAIICALVLIFIYLYSIRIWQIEITGNSAISVEEIKEELILENVKTGMRKKLLNFDTIKNSIYMRRDDILWIGFDVKGTKLKVEIIERTEPDRDNLEGKPCNIIANKDGLIKKITVLEGVKTVDVGSVVFKGDILVSGLVNSEHSGSRYVHSDAIILLKTWYTGKRSIPFEKTILSKTGNVENKYILKLGNYTINLTNNSTNFEKYDTINNVKKLTLFGKFELPIQLMTTSYEEIYAEEIKYEKSKAEEIAKEEAYNIAKENIPIDAKTINVDYKVLYTDYEVIVQATVECEETVGIKEEIIN